MSENSATQLLLFADSFLQCTLQLLELSELCLDYGGVRLQYARNKLERFLIFDIRNQTHEIDRFKDNACHLLPPWIWIQQAYSTYAYESTAFVRTLARFAKAWGFRRFCFRGNNGSRTMIYSSLPRL